MDARYHSFEYVPRIGMTELYSNVCIFKENAKHISKAVPYFAFLLTVCDCFICSFFSSTLDMVRL